MAWYRGVVAEAYGRSWCRKCLGPVFQSKVDGVVIGGAWCWELGSGDSVKGRVLLLDSEGGSEVRQAC